MNIALLAQNIFTLRTVFYAAHSIKNLCSISEAYIIILLFEQPLNMHQILRATDRNRTTISHILKNLSDRKLIHLSADSYYSLTQSGLDLYQKIVDCVSHAACR